MLFTMPFKVVTVEYFEELNLREPAEQRIKVKTTICDYNSGGSRGEPNIVTTYEYL
jgi:hypothetical protein